MALTPYMSLLLPTVSVTLGTTWADENNDAFGVIDSHDHTTGKGLQVPTAGLNINEDLDFNGYNLTGLRSSRFETQASPIAEVTDLGCLYVSGVDLYYNDGSGNQIQLTAGGALNASSIGGIGGDYATSSASVFYTSASKTYSFWQDTNKSALMDCGTILLRRTDITSSAAITIRPDASLTAGYTLTLPIAAPASTSFVGIDSSGNFSFTNSLVTLTLSGSFSVGSLVSNLIPTDATYQLGDSTHNFKSIYLDNGATDGGAVYFNAGGSVLLGSADGTELTISGFTSIYPGVNNVTGLGTSSRKFTFLQLGTNIGTSTPTANRLYADLIPKAWAYTNSAGTLQAGVNVTVVRSGSVGSRIYTYTFRTNMANANYAVLCTIQENTSGTSTSLITSKTVSQFVVEFRNSASGANYEFDHAVTVMGTQ